MTLWSMYIFVAIMLIAVFVIPAHADHDAQNFDGLTVVYIGLDTRGDSTLIILPNDKTILIDGGLAHTYTVIHDTLQDFGVSTIDTMIVTHPDSDHVGGLNALLEDDKFEVKDVLISSSPKDTKTYKKFLELAQGETISYASDTINLDPNVAITIISPPSESPIKAKRNASLENSNSLITLLQYGTVKFLFTADATYTTEEWLIENYPSDTLDVDIMNAPHHGSKHASTTEFINATSPEVVIFSADHDNQYGHPDPEAIARYQSVGINHTYTTLDKNIIVQTDGAGCSITVEDSEVACFEGVRMASSTPAPSNATIVGTVFNDANHNGMLDAGEHGIPGINILVYDYIDSTVHRSITGVDGTYNVSGIEFGQTALSQIVLPIHKHHLPSNGIKNLIGYTPPLDSESSVATINFPLHYIPLSERGTITFDVYHDTNNNGAKDEGEPGVPGAIVYTFEILTYAADVKFTNHAGSTTHTGLNPDVVLAQISYSDPATGNILLPEGFTRITTTNMGFEYFMMQPNDTRTLQIGLGR